MNNPQLKFLSKSMFAVEGNSNVILVTQTRRGFTQEAMWFPHPVTALEWCLKHNCNFTYSHATDPGKN